MNIYRDMPDVHHSATSISVSYNVLGALDGNNAPLDDRMVRQAVLAQIYADFPPVPPNTLPNYCYPINNPLPWPLRQYEQKEVGFGVWKCSATFTLVNYTFAFELNGKQQKVYYGKDETVYGSGTLPTFGRGINVDAKSVHGVDILVPAYSWTEGYEVPTAQVTDDYEALVYGLVGKTNQQAFRGKDIGEVLLLGASGSASSHNPQLFTLTFKFAAEKNKLNMYVGSIGNVDKNGWQYLWIYFEESVDSGASIVRKVPKYVVVNTVYDPGDFSDLNIGVGLTRRWGG